MKSFNILNSKKVQLIMLMSLVFALTLGVYLFKGKEIVLEVDGKKTDAVSYSKTVGEFLEQEDIDFKEGAFVNLPLETKIEDSLNIIIINPKVYRLKQQNGMKVVSSIYDTVGEVLKDKGIELEDLDYTKPALSERINEDDTIEIIRVKQDIVIEEEKIAFEKLEEKSDAKFVGQTAVKQRGVEGIKANHIEKRYENGKLVRNRLVKEEMTQEKKDHITIIGTKAKPVPKPKAKPVSRSSISRSRNTKAATNNSSKAPSSSASVSGKTITMSASAYDLSYASTGKNPGDRGYGITASGMKARYGVVAVDTRVIPLGTKLYIEGYGNAIAGDTGGAIKGNRIDLFYNSRSEAMNFGRRQVKVTILN